ncbi:MAG: SGNH/GDSL hydrolase family protein [Bacteroidetes bacterium]|nr:SGNH/GDSL hydrolase family protein [Bacteroidota bacterium]MDA0859991.1 SGNH/GDSL hydrolase family protein [Bacteroidota bacterium]MDA1318088.1 SGNH/GDSL hydrolase family protein [Bacteroidota bacterium]
MRRFLISFCAFTQVFLSFQKLNAQEESSKIFESGNTICFLGDSITHGGQYHEFLQLFYATRYPNLKLTFHNCGISGDNTEGMIYRLDKDVYIHKPSHVFFMTGMNDVIRTLYFKGEASNEIIQNRKKALDEYKRNIHILDKKFKTSDIRPLYLTPSIYDQYSKIERENNMGCNDALIECSTYLKKIAKQRNITVVDLNSSMKHIMERELKNDSLFTIVGKDRVHPETTGHFVMFHEIISTIESPSIVSEISIDLNEDNFTETKNCMINNFEFSSDDISFNCVQNSLPFPTNKAIDKALSLVPFENDFNKEILQIKGLKNGEYDLFIQDVFIKNYSAKQLNSGVNLSTQVNTPQYKQALEVMKLCEDYRKTSYLLRAVPFMEFKYLRDYNGNNQLQEKQIHLNKKLKTIEGKPYHNYIKKSMDAYVETLPKQDSLNKQLRQVQNAIYKKNKPKTLEWRLTRRQ